MATIDRKNCKVVEPEYNAAVIKAWQDANKNPTELSIQLENEEIDLNLIKAWDPTQSSYNKASHTLSLGKNWQGGDIWIGGKDIPNYSNLIFNFKTTGVFAIEVRYEGEDSGKKYKIDKNKQTLKVPLDKKKKLNHIIFQTESAAAKITFTDIVLSVN